MNCGAIDKPPIAFAGNDISVKLPENTIVLDARTSGDPNGKIVAYEWSKILGPEIFNILNPSSEVTEVINLQEGVYQFELKVTNAAGLWAKDTVSVTVISIHTTDISDCFIPGSVHMVNLLSNPVGSGAAVVCNNKIFITGNPTNGSDINIFDPQTNQITLANLSMGRWGITAVGTPTKAFFAGGYTASMNGTLSRVNIYDANTNRWSTTKLSIPRTGMAAGTVGNKVFFAGGITGYPNVTSRVDIYDLATGKWTIAELSEARGDFAAALVGNKILFAGGRTATGSSSRVDIYDAGTNYWSTTNLSQPLTELTSVGLNNKAYFTGVGFGEVQTKVEV
jgi:hypothetical protein